jgi:phosphinothricin acetyltransferase
MPVVIRPCDDTDLATVAAIYAHHVATSVATFEIEPPTVAEMARRRQAVTDKGLPWLVADIGGEVVGYAYAGPYRSRPAWDWTIEDSIYIHHRHTGKGVGRALLEPLVARAAELGYRQMVAVIGGGPDDNPGSVALHRACGFHPVGVLAAVGWKFGRWVDSMLMQRSLGPGAGEPVNP